VPQNTQASYAGRPQERGVALLIVLLLITVMSTVAYAVTDDIRFALRRTANIHISSQMAWYARGADAMARKALWGSWKANPGRSTLSDPWAREGVSFALDGGSIAGRITDAGTCFNLNSMAERGPTGLYVESPLGRAQFTALLTALEFDRQHGAALAGALVDWIDSDSAPSGYGAEDDTYALRKVPYRTGGTLLAEPSELRAIAGFTEDIYQRLRPLVCALPTPDLTRLNINTIRPDQAALVVMLVGSDLRLNEVARFLSDRPVDGFSSLNAFFSADVFAGLDIDQNTRSQFVTHSQYFSAETTVQFHESSLAVNTLMYIDSGGDITTYARRIGVLD